MERMAEIVYIKAKRICAMLCLISSILMMLTVFARFAVNRIWIERFGMETKIASVFFADFKGERPREDIDSSQYADKNIYERKINVVKSVVETYAGKLLCFREGLISGAYKYDNFVRWSAPKDPTDAERIIYMQNGYLTFVQPELSDGDIDEIAHNIKAFNDYLETKNIPLIYVNAGSKVCKEDKQLSEYDRAYEYTNENADKLLTYCNKLGINTLDLRANLKSETEDWYSLYYKTDHHWTTEAALSATQSIAEYLNERCGFNYRTELFSGVGFEKTLLENIMFGSQGRSVTEVNAKHENYTLVLPKHEGEYRLEVPCENLVLDGAYTDTLFDLAALEEIKNYSSKDYLEKPDAYNATRMNNYPSSTVTKLDGGVNENRKVLLVQDSFGWYVSTYLATQTGEIDTFNPISNENSLEEYVDATSPDVVIILCNQRTINPVSAAGTDSFWYLK